MEEQPSLMDLRIGLYNDMVEKEVEGGKAVAIKAYRAAREESDHDAESDAGDKMSAALINRVDAMLQKLENEIDDVYAKIDDRWWLLDRKCSINLGTDFWSNVQRENSCGRYYKASRSGRGC